MTSGSYTESNYKGGANELASPLSPSSSHDIMPPQLSSRPASRSEFEVEVGDTPEKCRHEGWKQGLLDIQVVFVKTEIMDIRIDSKLTNTANGINDSIELNEQEFINTRKTPTKIDFMGHWRTGYNHAIQLVNRYLKDHRNSKAKDTWGKSEGEQGKVEGIRKGLQIMIRATEAQDYYFYLKGWFMLQQLQDLREKKIQFENTDYIPKLEIDLGGEEHINALGKTSGQSNRLKLVEHIERLIELRKMQEGELFNGI